MAREAAYEEVLIAEGSDWFWWYGDDHSSDHDAEFDDLFRRHLRNAYRLLNRPVPDDLFITNISTSGPVYEVQPPIGWIAPVIDGRETSYFEWLGAGSFDVRRAGGAMHQIDAAPPVVTSIRFGFSQASELCIRLEGPSPMAEQLAAGYEFTVAFLGPKALKLTAKSNGSDNGCYVNHDAAHARVATVLELCLPLAVLDAVPGALVSFAIAVTCVTAAPDGVDRIVAVERHPDRHPIDVQVPGREFDAAHWRA